MEKIDFIIAIPLIWGLIIGFKKGLVLELASFAALILGVLGALSFSDFVGEKLSAIISISPEYLGLASFFTTFVLIVVGVFLLARIIDKSLKLIALGMVNRILGALFGLLKYALITSFALYFFNFLNQKLEFVSNDYQEKSLLYKPVMLLKAPFSSFLEEFEFNELEEKANEAKEFILESP